MMRHPRLVQVPPEKGSFPLDHEGACKDLMKKYMECLRKTKSDNSECRLESKNYFQCRMEKDLMKKEEWSKLGYHDIDNTDTKTIS